MLNRYHVSGNIPLNTKLEVAARPCGIETALRVSCRDSEYFPGYMFQLSMKLKLLINTIRIKIG